MRNHRLYYPTLTNTSKTVVLEKAATHYLLQVLRCKTGQRIELFNGTGDLCHAVIQSADKHSVTLELLGCCHQSSESPLPIHLALGISKGERMDTAIQKAVELGVHAIQPLQTEYSVVKLNAERAAKRLQHWQGIIISACEQCGRNTLPKLHPVQTLQDWLNQPHDMPGWLFHPSSTHRLSDMPKPEQGVSILIGPEGGLAEKEISHACTKGFHSLNFGPRILRTETAAIACISAIQTLWGDLG